MPRETDERGERSGREGADRTADSESPVRGDRSDFDREVYPRSYPVPGRINLKRAMRAYVRGHDRGWDVERKAGLADEEAGYRGPGQAIDSGEPQGPPGSAAGGDAGPGAPGAPGGEAAGTAEGARYGVGVPDRLSFRRGADTWRRRLPESGAFRPWRRTEDPGEPDSPGKESGG